MIRSAFWRRKGHKFKNWHAVTAAGLLDWKQPNTGGQNDHRPVAAEQSATSLAQLGQHIDVQGQSNVSSSGDALQPMAAEQPAGVATAQLGDEQGQSSMDSRDEHSAAVVPSPTTSNAQLDVHTTEAASDKPKPAVKRRHRKVRPRNVRAGRIEKRKRARRQRREAAARAPAWRVLPWRDRILSRQRLRMG